MSNKSTLRLLAHSPSLRRTLRSRFPPGRRHFTNTPHHPAPPQPPRNPFDPIALRRYEAQCRAYDLRRTYYAAAGAIFSMLAIVALVQFVDIPPPAEKCEASSPGPEWGRAAVIRGAEIRKQGGEDGDGGVEQVPTGTSTVPTFPKTIRVPGAERSGVSAALPAGTGSLAPDSEYQLLGLGIRTVSFLGIQVYVVGLYIATSDIAVLQQQLVRRAAATETATTLVGGEKEALRGLLMDAEGSERVWGEVLREGGVRSVWRIVPTRNTDFAHLRDGWVRGITARSQRGGGEYEDQGFGEAMGEFKAVFGGKGRKGVKKGRVLLLERLSLIHI